MTYVSRSSTDPIGPAWRSLVADRRGIARKLRDVGPELRTARAQISSLRQDISQLERLSQQLAEIEETAPKPSPELEAERLAFEQRQQLLRDLRDLEEQRASTLAALAEPRRLAREIGDSIAATRLFLGKMAPTAEGPLDTLSQAVKELLSAADRTSEAALSELLVRLEQQFEEESEEYFRLRQLEQDVNEALKKQQALVRQVQHLEKQRLREAELQDSKTRLLERRKNLRSQLGQVEDELYEIRVREIDSINREHGDTVQLTLGASWNTPAYAKALTDLLVGSRIRAQDEVAWSLAERLEPSSLIDLIETGDAQRLADLLGRDLGQMTRVVAHLGDHDDLYSLETELPAARLQITLFDEGQPKPVEALSKGQRATALLPIILRPLPYPLLFDQPEDDLDNKFIFRSLIATLRRLKAERQLIFVTHNANIPVLGGR